MEKYRADWSSIVKVELLEETRHMIRYKINGSEAHQRKSASFYKWFDTFEEAKTYIVDTRKEKINRLLEILKFEHIELEKAEALIENQQIV